jgi:hypothetical protein
MSPGVETKSLIPGSEGANNHPRRGMTPASGVPIGRSRPNRRLNFRNQI